MYNKFGIKEEILELSKQVEKECEVQFAHIEKIKEINSLKVLSAFQKCVYQKCICNLQVDMELTSREEIK